MTEGRGVAWGGVGAVVQRWRGKCPDSAGGGVGRRVTGFNDITSCPSAFPVTCPPILRSDFAKVLWGAFKRSSSCLGNTAETRRETGAPVRTDAAACATSQGNVGDLTYTFTLKRV